jgi:hypothetical protein
MHIEITNLDGSHVTDIQVTPMNLASKIEEAKTKYPKGKYHATLVNY